MRTMLWVMAGCLLAAGCAGPSNPEAENAAVAAADAWLRLVDGGQYGQSWDEAAVYFKGAVARDKWEEMMAAGRKPFGACASRNVKAKKYATSLPGAPDGQYVVIQFAASFDNKKQAVETVTPMLDQDGTWRVAGYYIR